MRRCAREIAEPGQADNVFRQIEEHFAMESAPLIGTIERVIYVFGIMFAGAYALISGWLVLKAFSAWLQGSELQPNPIRGRMAYYHLYLYGNALSLMTGLALGFVGLQLSGWSYWAALIGRFTHCISG
jgi:uncharacterized metal-binding protein